MSGPSDEPDEHAATGIPSAGHLTTEQLDELATQASADADPDQAPTSGPADSAAQAHLAGCPTCRTALGDQIAVQAWLRRVPDVGPMPAELATRIDTALANARSAAAPAPGGNVVPMSRPDRRTGVLGRLAESRVTKSLVAAAAVSLIAVGGWAAIDHRSAGTDSTASGASDSGGSLSQPDAQDEKSAAAAVRASGTAYTSQNLVAEVDKQLAQPSGSRDVSGFAANVDGGATLTTPEGLQSCLTGLGSPSVIPLLVDLATYAGKPAAVIVLPTADGQKVAWVVSPSCSNGNDGTIFYAAIK